MSETKNSQEKIETASIGTETFRLPALCAGLEKAFEMALFRGEAIGADELQSLFEPWRLWRHAEATLRGINP